MKKIRFTFSILVIILLSACKVGMISESKGKAQEAFLQFVQTQTKYENGVEVTIDNGSTFNAKVDKQTKRGVYGNTYAIPTGKHHLTVKSAGKILYDQEIFTSSQQTKQISLP